MHRQHGHGAHGPDTHPEHGPDLIQVSRFESWLRKLLSIKASGLIRSVDPLFSISTDPVASMSMEQRYHQGIRTFTSEVSRAASVGNSGYLCLYNPAGSKQLVVVESASVLTVAAAASSILLAGQSWPGFAAANLAVPCDVRALTLQPAFPAFTLTVAGAQLGQGDTAAAPATTALLADSTTIPATSVSYPNNFLGYNGRTVILPPGWSVTVRGPVNTAVRMFIGWYERACEGSELT